MKAQLALVAALFFAVSAFGQNQATGFPPFGTFQNGQFDSVNLQNLNVNFAIPIVSTPGRGLNFAHSLTSNSLIWVPVFIQGDGTYWTPTTDEYVVDTWGWKLDEFTILPEYASQSVTCQVDHKIATHYFNFNVLEDNGTVHPFATLSFYSQATACNFNTTLTCPNPLRTRSYDAFLTAELVLVCNELLG